MILNNLVFRPACMHDLNDIMSLSQRAQFGISTLPTDRSILEHYIQQSIFSFSKDVIVPSDEQYLFVIEDLEYKKVVGISRILASVGGDDPFFSFKCVESEQYSRQLNISNKYNELYFQDFLRSSSEIGTLFLLPEYRQKYVGRFLSVSRFLFMANNAHRFRKVIVAELRGVSDASGYSPFYEDVIKPFFGISFVEADRLSLSDKSFITELMPKQPFLVETFSKRAQNVISKTHALTVPAMRILESEGFVKTNVVDIFDGGPKVSVELKKLRAYYQSKYHSDFSLSDLSQNEHLHLCSFGKDASFRVCCVPALVENEGLIKLSNTKSLRSCLDQGSLVSYLRLISKSRVPLNCSAHVLDDYQIHSDTSFLNKFSNWYHRVLSDQSVTHYNKK